MFKVSVYAPRTLQEQWMMNGSSVQRSLLVLILVRPFSGDMESLDVLEVAEELAFHCANSSKHVL